MIVVLAVPESRQTTFNIAWDYQGCNFQKVYSTRKNGSNVQAEVSNWLPLREQSGAGVGVEPLGGIDCTQLIDSTNRQNREKLQRRRIKVHARYTKRF